MLGLVSMLNKIDITITACRRRRILRRTLESFYDNLLWRKDVLTRIIINVDPVGDNEDSMLSVDLCRDFTDDVVFRCPDSPNFGKAFKWTWTKVDSDWVLNLEDDWELLTVVDIKDIFEILKKFQKLALLRFPFDAAGRNKIMAWSKVPFDWNGDYFECNEKHWAYCGHPSVIKSAWIKRMLPLIKPELSPEKQFRASNPPLIKQVLEYDYGLFGGPYHDPYIRDLGRNWMKKFGWKKTKRGHPFAVWEKI